MAGERNNLLAAAIVFLILNGIVVSLRIYVRTRVVMGFGWDDFVLCLTYIGYIISTGLGFAAIHYGYAADDIQPWYDATKATRFTYGNQTTLYISAGLVKLAVALVLLRITVSRGIRWVLIVSIFIVGAWTIITIVFASWICAAGGSSNWAGSTRCTQVGYFRTISNIFIDYFYALVPVYMLKGAQMKTRLKLIAIFLLSLGVFASTATIVKLVILVRLTYNTGAEEASLHYQLLLWADIELGLAIFAASAAALRPLLRHIPTLLDTTGSRSKTATESGPYHELTARERNASSAANPTPGPRQKTNADSSAANPASSDEDLFRGV